MYAIRSYYEGNRPLAGVRALDLTRVLAGPTCARTLAEHGADVLKITAAHLPDSGDTDLDTGLGKLSAQLDLRKAEDAETLRRLAGVLSRITSYNVCYTKLLRGKPVRGC